MLVKIFKNGSICCQSTACGKFCFLVCSGVKHRKPHSLGGIAQAVGFPYSMRAFLLRTPFGWSYLLFLLLLVGNC